MNTQTQPVTQSLPFWMTYPREGFTATVEREELPRMRKSKEAAQVLGVVVGYLEGPSKPKGSR